jgi:hypothetical protein
VDFQTHIASHSFGNGNNPDLKKLWGHPTKILAALSRAQVNTRNGSQNRLRKQLTPVITEHSSTATHAGQSQPPLFKLANGVVGAAAGDLNKKRSKLAAESFEVRPVPDRSLAG